MTRMAEISKLHGTAIGVHDSVMKALESNTQNNMKTREQHANEQCQHRASNADGRKHAPATASANHADAISDDITAVTDSVASLDVVAINLGHDESHDDGGSRCRIISAICNAEQNGHIPQRNQ